MTSIRFGEGIKTGGTIIRDCVTQADVDRLNCACRVVPDVGTTLPKPVSISIDCRFPKDFDYFPDAVVIDVLRDFAIEVEAVIRKFETFCLSRGVPEFVDQWPE